MPRPSYQAPALATFEEQYARVFEASECRTQTELAEVLEIKQSSISDAKRRQRIPAEWRIKLFEKLRVNPDWILYGDATTKYLAPVDAEQHQPQVVVVTEIRPPQECSS